MTLHRPIPGQVRQASDGGARDPRAGVARGGAPVPATLRGAGAHANPADGDVARQAQVSTRIRERVKR